MSLANTTPKSLGPAEIISLALRGWKLIVLGTVLGAAAGFFVTRWMHPKYQTSLMVQVNTQAKRPAGGLGDMADLFQTDSKAETEVVVIQSGSVLGPVADSFHLQNRWASTGALRRLMHKEGRLELPLLELPPRPVDAKGTWTLTALDSTQTFAVRDLDKREVLRGRVGELATAAYGNDSVRILVSSLKSEPGEVFGIWKISHPDAVDLLQKNLKVVEQGRRTDILSLTFTDPHPKAARDILDDIASSYVQQNIEVRSSEARKSLAYLQGQIPEVRHRLDSLEEILNVYRFQKGTIDIGTEARVYLDDQSRIQQQILALDQQKQELLRLYREDHPSILAVDARRKQLQSALVGSSRQVKSLPNTQQQILKLQRDLDVNTSIYTNLLNNVQQLQIVQGGEVGNSRIVDWAELPTKTTGPSQIIILVFAILAGAGGAFALLILMHLFKDGVSDPADLELTGIPVLAQIPDSAMERAWKRKKGRKPVLAVTAPNELAVEALRSLRTALNLTLSAEGPNVLAIGGLVPGVGKSFVCANLAALYALQGKKVVVVDADLRRGRLHELFGQSTAGGLAEVVRGQRALSEVLLPTDIPGLSYLGNGLKTDNPVELLETPAFSDLLIQLSSKFEVVLIDTSPLLLVSDAIPVFKQSKHTLLVLQSGAHTVSTINQGIRKLLQFRIESVSIAMNQCDLDESPYKGYGAYVKK